MVESLPADQVRPKLRKQVYELPGDKLDTHELWLFDIEGRMQSHVDSDPIDWWGPPEPRWSPDNRHFTYEHTHRGSQRVRVIEVDAETGKTRTIIDDRAAAVKRRG